MEAKEIKARARGMWIEILLALAPELEPASRRPGRHVPCPVHGGRDGFRLFRDAHETGGGICNTCGAFSDGFAVLMWLRGWRFPEAVKAVAGIIDPLGAAAPPSRRRTVPPPPPPSVSQEEMERRAERLRRWWKEALPIEEAAPLRAYLARRGLPLPSDRRVMRLHPSLPYFERREGRVRKLGVFPTVLAMVQDGNGKPVTLHRIFLTTRGEKAPVASPKKLACYHEGARELRGAAIRLAPPGQVLGVAEGIETALAVQDATGLPVWACISATLMEQFTPPPGTRLVRIFADKDRNGRGEKAARTLASRLKELGVGVRVELPPVPIPEGAKGVDWADVPRAERVSMLGV